MLLGCCLQGLRERIISDSKLHLFLSRQLPSHSSSTSATTLVFAPPPDVLQFQAQHPSAERFTVFPLYMSKPSQSGLSGVPLMSSIFILTIYPSFLVTANIFISSTSISSHTFLHFHSLYFFCLQVFFILLFVLKDRHKLISNILGLRKI